MFKPNDWIKTPRDNLYSQIKSINDNDTITMYNGLTIMGIEWAESYYQLASIDTAIEQFIAYINTGVYRPNQFNIEQLDNLLHLSPDAYWSYKADDTWSYLYNKGTWYIKYTDQTVPIKPFKARYQFNTIDLNSTDRKYFHRL